jgi:hypothetical protein
MSTRRADRSDDSAATSKPRKTPPARVRNYRIVAEPRTEPDLHKLAQLFIGMALARTDAERPDRRGLAGQPRQEPPQDAGN